MADAQDSLTERPVDSRASVRYALLFAPPGRRASLQALAVLHGELHAIVNQVSEPAVAAAKLDWWRHEIELALRGSAQHPLGPALHRMTSDFDVPAEYLREMADAVEIELGREGFSTCAELNRYLYKSGAVPAIAAATILGYSDPATLRAAKHWGFAVRRITLLRDLRPDVLNGQINLPRAKLDTAGLEAHNLLAESSKQKLRPLLNEMAREAVKDCRDALAALPVRDQPRQRPLCVLSELYRALLARMTRDGLHVQEKRYALHPARKLWIAWRTAHRAERAQLR